MVPKLYKVTWLNPRLGLSRNRNVGRGIIFPTVDIILYVYILNMYKIVHILLAYFSVTRKK